MGTVGYSHIQSNMSEKVGNYAREYHRSMTTLKKAQWAKQDDNTRIDRAQIVT